MTNTLNSDPNPEFLSTLGQGPMLSILKENLKIILFYFIYYYFFILFIIIFIIIFLFYLLIFF